MYEADIAVIFYPNLLNVERVIILDPFDQKVKYFSVSSIDEVKQVLKENLPFCSQGHSPIIHMGDAHLLSWADVPDSEYRISSPEDIDSVIDKVLK